MKKIRKIILLLCFFVLTFEVFGQDTTAVFAKCSTATVSVEMNKGQGAGFIVGNGKVITNFHVIEEACSGYVTICGQARKYYISGYYAIDIYNNLALLCVPEISGEAMEIRISEAKTGENVYVIGTQKDNECSLTSGAVSSLNMSEIRMDAAVSNESSGSPVLDKNGQLIGVAVAGRKDEQNLNFAIPAKYVTELMRKPTATVFNLPCYTPSTVTFTPKPQPTTTDTMPFDYTPHPSKYVCMNKDAFGWDFPEPVSAIWLGIKYGLHIPIMGFRWLHHFNPYLGMDYAQINLMVLETDDFALQFMTGARVQLPLSMYNCASLYAACRIGYQMSYWYINGFCSEAEVGVNINSTFFMGLTCNYWVEGASLALKIGFNIGK